MPITFQGQPAGTTPGPDFAGLVGQQAQQPDVWPLLMQQFFQQQAQQSQNMLAAQTLSRTPDPGIMGFEMGRSPVLQMLNVLAQKPIVEGQLQSQEASGLLRGIAQIAALQKLQASTADLEKKTSLRNRQQDTEERKVELMAQDKKLARQLQAMGLDIRSAQLAVAQMRAETAQNQYKLDAEMAPYRYGLEISPLEQMKLDMEKEKQNQEAAIDMLKTRLEELKVSDRHIQTTLEAMKVDLARSREDRLQQADEREQQMFNEKLRKAQAYDEELARVLDAAKAMDPKSRNAYFSQPEVIKFLNDHTGLNINSQGWMERMAKMLGDALGSYFGGSAEPTPAPTAAPTVQAAPTQSMEDKLMEKLNGR